MLRRKFDTKIVPAAFFIHPNPIIIYIFFQRSNDKSKRKIQKIDYKAWKVELLGYFKSQFFDSIFHDYCFRTER